MRILSGKSNPMGWCWLRSLFQSSSKRLYTSKTRLGVFGQRGHHHLFYLGRKAGNLLSKGGRSNELLLGGNLCKGAMKGTLATEPFIDDNAQRVLITCRAGMRFDLLGSHVGNGSGYIVWLLEARALGYQGNAKVAEHHLVVRPEQHVFWLDISMNNLAIMSVLKGFSDLLDVGDDLFQGQTRSFWIA